MGAATCQMQYAYGAGPTLANAETGIKFNREDTQTGTTPIPIPTATGTDYSWYKALALVVTGTGTTNISNRKCYSNGAAATGLYLWWKNFGSDTYAQATDGNRPADVGTGPGTLPAGYTTLKTDAGSADVWDSASVATSSTGKNGKYCVTEFGVSDNYAGGAGSAIALPDLKFQYDEA